MRLELLFWSRSLEILWSAYFDIYLVESTWIEVHVLLAEVVVTWAKEEEGRIRERKRRVEENGRVLEHAQDDFARCLARIAICQKERYSSEKDEVEIEDNKADVRPYNLDVCLVVITGFVATNDEFPIRTRVAGSMNLNG